MFSSCPTKYGAHTLDCIFPLLATIIYWALFFVGAAAVIMIIIGGIRFITSGGDAKRVEGAKVIIAWIFYILPLFIFIKIPLALAFGALGAALAFLPVGGRPMDVMIKNFFKAVFSPTQYVYQKTGGQLLNDNAQSPQDATSKRRSIAQM